MFYHFTADFELKGIVSDIIATEIMHSYVEADTLFLSIPYEKEKRNVLQTGDFLYRPTQQKAYRIHTMEVEERVKTMEIYAYGLESLLTQRVIEEPVELRGTVIDIMHQLVEDYFISPANPNRRVPFLQRAEKDAYGTSFTKNVHGTDLYSLFFELGKEHGVGYRFHYLPKEKNITFATYRGVDRTTLQQERTPIRWSAAWGDTRGEILLHSAKDHKNTVYLLSGDEENPIKEEMGGGIGLDRYESFLHDTGVRRDLAGEDAPPLTDAQVLGLLQSRGSKELLQKQKISQYHFQLNEDVTEQYGVDYAEGDMVSVVNEHFGITRHARIQTVIERVQGDVSVFNIEFED